MNDPLAREFSRFSQDKLRPAVDVVAERKRSGFLYALGVAVIVFLVFAGASYFMISPYRQLMGEHGIVYWPLLLLVPASLAVIGFSLAYILSLRNTVKEFRKTLVGRMAEFIDPGLVHESGRPFTESEFASSLLFPAQGKAISCKDHFRGRAGAAAVDIGDIVVKREENGKAPALIGLFFTTRYADNFRTFVMILPANAPASLSGFEESLKGGGDAGSLVRLENPADDRQVVVPSLSLIHI